MTKTTLVCSLKGGTGKSTISAFLATYLAQKGKETILIDADIDSPNLADILKVDYTPKITPNKIEIAHLDNMDFFSMGLITKNKGVSMSGDAYVQMLLDVLNYADWKVNIKNANIVIDCPAGASDLFKGVIRAFADSIVGAVIVIVPSAYNDLERIIKILNHYSVPIIGVIENMAYFRCDCGREYRFFGGGKLSKIKNICLMYNVPYLGQVPITPELWEVVEAGIPYIPDEVSEILSKIESFIEISKPVKDNILKKLTRKVSEKVKRSLAKIIVKSILKVNKEINIKRLTEKGFGGNVVELIITDKGEVLSQVYLKLSNGKLMVVEKPKTVNLSIVAKLQTLIDVAKNKIDLETAFYYGDIEIYGSGGTIRALSFFQELWNEMKDDIARVGEVLEEYEE